MYRDEIRSQSVHGLLAGVNNRYPSMHLPSPQILGTHIYLGEAQCCVIAGLQVS